METTAGRPNRDPTPTGVRRTPRPGSIRLGPNGPRTLCFDHLPIGGNGHPARERALSGNVVRGPNRRA